MMKVQYPIIVEEGGNETAWGITVPDLTGCFSAADNENDILDVAREAILLHLEGLENIPDASPIENFTHDNNLVLLVDVDLAQFEGQAKRINITVPQGLLLQIDRAAKLEGKTRSDFLTEAARKNLLQ